MLANQHCVVRFRSLHHMPEFWFSNTSLQVKRTTSCIIFFAGAEADEARLWFHSIPFSSRVHVSAEAAALRFIDTTAHDGCAS